MVLWPTRVMCVTMSSTIKLHGNDLAMVVTGHIVLPWTAGAGGWGAIGGGAHWQWWSGRNYLCVCGDGMPVAGMAKGGRWVRRAMHTVSL